MIKLIRLVSGEELLADVNEAKLKEDPTKVSFMNPLIMVPTGEGKLGVTDYMPYSDITKGVTMPMDHIMFMVNPIDDFISAHKERFGGIITPTSKLVGVK